MTEHIKLTILKLYWEHGPLSDHEIADLLAIPATTVRGPRHILAKEGYVRPSDTSKTKEGMPTLTWDLTERGKKLCQQMTSPTWKS